MVRSGSVGLGKVWYGKVRNGLMNLILAGSGQAR